MAHSTATGEINYFFQDENGKILKVLKQTDIKQEPAFYSDTVKNSANNSNMGAYNQLNSSNQSQFVRIHDGYNVQTPENAGYNVLTQSQSSSNSSNSNGAVKYETTSASYNGKRSNNKVEEQQRYPKYTTNSNTKIKTKIHTTSSTIASVQKKRKPEKAGKGLRHFSMKVCEKVKEKGITTYNEVADELVTEEVKNNSFDAANCDQKNIRRRVYDALNVLMAMQIIAKDKKEIRWIGLPESTIEQCSALERENEERRERIDQKHEQLRELLLQQVAFKSLIERNKTAERQGIIPTPNSSIQLPFIIVNTHKSTKINCSVTNDKSEYIFKFDDQFEMHDDADVLKRMGLLYGLDKGSCSLEDIERAKMLVPPNFEKYIEAYGNGKGINTSACDSDDDLPSYLELSNNNDSQGYTRTTDGGGKSPECDDEDDDLLEHSDVD